MGRSHLAEAAIWAAATWEAAVIWEAAATWAAAAIWAEAATGEAATDRSCGHVEQSGLIGVEIEIPALLRGQTMTSASFPATGRQSGDFWLVRFLLLPAAFLFTPALDAQGTTQSPA
jgi:hypothetical protein